MASIGLIYLTLLTKVYDLNELFFIGKRDYFKKLTNWKINVKATLKHT